MALKVLSGFSNSTKQLLAILNRYGVKKGFDKVLAGKDFFELDRYLLEKKLINQELLARGYAEFYRLPFVRLVNRPIEPRVAGLLPEEILRRYKVVPYQLQGPNLYLAVGEPARLARNAPSVLVNLRHQKGLNIHLAITPREDAEAVINKIHRRGHLTPDESPRPAESPAPSSPKQPEPPAKPVPSLSEAEVAKPARPVLPAELAPPSQPKAVSAVKQVETHFKTIDFNHAEVDKSALRKIPYNVAKRYRLVVFAEEPSKSKFEAPLIKIAAVDPKERHVREIISYIESKNKVSVERYQTNEASFKIALSHYDEASADTSTATPPSEPEAQIKEERSETRPSADVPSQTKVESPTAAKAPEQPKTEPVKPTRIPTSDEGLALSSDDIINRASEQESPEELRRLAEEQASNLEQQNLDKLLKGPVATVEELAKVFRSGIIPQIVAGTLFLAIRMKASDVHIEAQEDGVRVRFRVDGILHDIIRVPGFLHAPLISRIKILAKMKIDEQRVPQDGRFDVQIDNRQVDLRVSTLPTVHGEKIVMRLLDKSAGILTLEQLGVTGTNFDTLVENISKPFGIILATGPTGSGKSTTLYAILSRISKPGVNIITLEDPVEYELPGINQAQVKPQIGFTFADGLRSVLRQDPNVIMVGEIRDLETAAMATHAALTGHLVLSTLHTNDASGALPRLINMGVEPFLITSSVNAVIAQRLVRKVCQHCKETAQIPPAILNKIKRELAATPSAQLKNVNLESLKFYRGKGCSNCNDGYSGRIGIFEVMAMSDKIEDLAVNKAPASELKKAAIEEGMITMLQDGLMKALKGITSVDEVLRVTTTEIREVPTV